VPTQYGAADACALVNCSYTWTGSTKADVGEMLQRLQRRRQRGPTGSRLRRGQVGVRGSGKQARRASPSSRTTPAAPARGRGRMAYIGGRCDSGFAMGERIAALVPKGDVGLPSRRRALNISRGSTARSPRSAVGQTDQPEGRRDRRRPEQGAHRSTRTTSATRTWPGCSRWTPATRRASARSSRSTA
jgi:hypothetical protein